MQEPLSVNNLGFISLQICKTLETFTPQKKIYLFLFLPQDFCSCLCMYIELIDAPKVGDDIGSPEIFPITC